MAEKRYEQAHRLRHVEGMSWAEVAAEMGCSPKAARNHEKYARQRLERSAAARERYATDEAYRAKKLDQCKRYRAEHGDEIAERRRSPEYRARVNAARRADPTYQQRQNDRRRERYASDPEYRERLKARANRYREKNLEKVRQRARERAADPEFRAKRAAWYAANRETLSAKQADKLRTDEEHAQRRREQRAEWARRNREHIAAYNQRPDVRAKRLLAMSRWRYGPTWGPVHRAVVDLNNAIITRSNADE